MRTSWILALAFLGSALATPLAAQRSPTEGPRGLAWVGCWQAVDGIASQGRVCVIPGAAHVLRIVTIDAGTESESALILSGERVPVAAGECTGWEQARISNDGDRVIVDAQLQCGTSPQRTTSTAFTITPAGYWLQVNGAGIGMVANARIRLYRAVESYEEVPADIRAAVGAYASDAESARAAMSYRAVSAGDLIELESMGVSTPVLDLIVAASYPQSFVIDAEGATSSTFGAEGVATADRSLTNSPFYFNGFPLMSAYDMERLRNCSRMGRISCSCSGSTPGYSSLGYSSVEDQGCGLGYYGANGYYGAYPGGGYRGGYGVPVVIRPVVSERTDAYPGRGRAVKGQGYSAGGGETRTRVATPRSGNSGSTTRSDGSSGSSTGSSSGERGSSSPSTERTAKPRKP